MSKSTVTLELRVVEGTRIKGWGEDAIYEYNLRHDKLTNELKFRCKRKDLEDILKDMGANLDKFDDVSTVSMADVGDELSRSSTGMPLSDREQKELTGMLSQDKPVKNQQNTGFRIKIG
jgi:hypothetical protein